MEDNQICAIVRRHAARDMAALAMLGYGIVVVRMLSFGEGVRKGRVYFATKVAAPRDGSQFRVGDAGEGVGYFDLPDNTLREPGANEFRDAMQMAKTELIPARGARPLFFHQRARLPGFRTNPEYRRGRDTASARRGGQSVASLGIHRWEST